MDHTTITTALAAAGLASRANELAALARPSIRLSATRVDPAGLATGASRLGGQPDLPGIPWPDKAGASLAFVAQIHLADAAPYDAEHLLPADGTLSFFYDASQQTYGDNPADRAGWHVFYFPEDAPLSASIVPSDLPQNARFPACALTFAPELTMPQQPPLERPGLPWTPNDEKAYESFLSALPRAATHHRLLGYPDTIQDDMRIQCQLVSHGVTDANDARAAALRAGAGDWTLLLQVDSDDQAGMRWGSAGMLYYWIERAALRNRAFDNVWLVLQSD
jgi:uncharacterized protein YwqG